MFGGEAEGAAGNLDLDSVHCWQPGVWVCDFLGSQAACSQRPGWAPFTPPQVCPGPWGCSPIAGHLAILQPFSPAAPFASSVG